MKFRIRVLFGRGFYYILIRIIALPEREADRAGVLTCEFLVHRPRIRGILWITSSFLLLCPQNDRLLWTTGLFSTPHPHKGGILWTTNC